MLKLSLKEGQYVNIGDDIRVVSNGSPFASFVTIFFKRLMSKPRRLASL